MGGQSDGFVLPTPQAEKRADSKPAKSGTVGAFRTIQPVIKIAFGARRVHFGVNCALVRLLVNNKTFGAGH